jgi:hypothetical protein
MINRDVELVQTQIFTMNLIFLVEMLTEKHVSFSVVQRDCSERQVVSPLKH